MEIQNKLLLLSTFFRLELSFWKSESSKRKGFVLEHIHNKIIFTYNTFHLKIFLLLLPYDDTKCERILTVTRWHRRFCQYK